MRKVFLNIVETILVLIIVLICCVSILQSGVMQGKTIFGYQIYMISSDSMFNDGDVILTKKYEFQKINNGDIVAYKEDNDIVAYEVIDILKENDITKLKIDKNGVDMHIYEGQFYGKYEYSLVFLSALSNLIKDKVWFVVCLLVPFSILVILEVINVTKEFKRKKVENTMLLQLEELQDVKDNSDLSKVIEDNIQVQLKEIKNAKRDFKKIDELEQTIQIPLEEIQLQIKKLTKEVNNEYDRVKDDTMILFTQDDIKEVIKNELKSTEIVDINKRKDEKSTKTAKNNKNNKKTTTIVEKDINNEKGSL